MRKRAERNEFRDRVGLRRALRREAEDDDDEEKTLIGVAAARGAKEKAPIHAEHVATAAVAVVGDGARVHGKAKHTPI